LNDIAEYRCPGCRSGKLARIEEFEILPRVTSDSKPFRPGGKLFVCQGCSLVQKIPDPAWLEEIGEIYRGYEMYHQTAAIDQVIFDPVSGAPRGRCEVLANRLIASSLLPEAGSLLDVGAGSGAMLSAFSNASNRWQLFGLDLDNRKEQALKTIPRFEKLFIIPPEQLHQQFDLLTLIHSLEHFSDPCEMLQNLRSLIAPGGKLFIEVNNAEKMPFDLIVADHLSHFTPSSLGQLVARAGFGIEHLSTDWVNKEISLLISPRSDATAETEAETSALVRTQKDIDWLTGLLDQARDLAADRNFGVFGTSVAATWLAAGLGDTIDFFVDEDSARKGRQHLGRPILPPEDVPAGATVFLAFIPPVASSIAKRLAHLPVVFSFPQA
jgi:SAM-dependent methyltransferase